jgi:hypothetical protein
MFLQVLQGKVSDAAAFNASIESWVSDLSAGAEGWLGTTSGIYAADGSFIALVRFESADAARRNSDRPEQDAWWSKTSSYVDGDVKFDDYDEVMTIRNGGSDQAGFVQVMQGRVADVERQRAMGEEFSQLPDDFRPDIIGGIAGLHDDGSFVQAMYFTSEAAAREGEQQSPPPEGEERMREMQTNTVEISFIDLLEPMFQSPG